MVADIEIEKNIPIPSYKNGISRRKKVQKYDDTILNMEIGDSILFPCKISWEKLKKRAEIKQRVESLPEFSGKLIAQRVWKIKEAM